MTYLTRKVADGFKWCSKCKAVLPIGLLIKYSKKGPYQYYHCRPCNANRLREYRKTPQGKLAFLKINRRQRITNRDKVKARQRLNWHVAAGNIIRPSRCTRCLQKGPVEGHHPSYQQPLNVVWLCRPCHLVVELEVDSKIQL